MKIAHFFIERPVFACAVSVIITLLGAITLPTLAVDQYPRIAPPTVTVSASYPGASAEVMAGDVAAPLEQQINGVDDMLYMSSQSIGEGRVNITVTFKLGTECRHRPSEGAEPGPDRPASIAPGSAGPRRHRPQGSERHPPDRTHDGNRSRDGSQVPGQLCESAGARAVVARPGSRRCRGQRRSRLCHAHLDRSGQGGGPESDSAGDRRRAAHQQLTGGRRRGRRVHPSPTSRLLRSSSSRRRQSSIPPTNSRMSSSSGTMRDV